MYRWLSRMGSNTAIVILAVIFLAHFVLQFEPYRVAENRIASELSADANINQQLVTYGTLSQEWQNRLGPAVGFARVVSLVLDVAAENDLVRAVDSMYGGRTLLNALEKTADNLLRLDRDLEQVRASTEVASSFVQLQDESTHFNQTQLTQMCEQTGEVSAGLNDINDYLGDTSTEIRELTENELLQGRLLPLLDRWRANVPREENLPNDLYRGFTAWRNVPSLIDEIRETIEEDVSTLNSVNRWCGFADLTDYFLTSFFVRDVAAWVNDHHAGFFSVLALSIAVAVAGWIGAFGLDQARWRGLSSREVIVVDRGSDPDRDEKRLLRRRKPTSVSATSVAENAETYSARPDSQTRQASLICTWPDGNSTTFVLPQDGKFTIGCGDADDVRVAPTRAAVSQAVIRRARVQYFLQVSDNDFPVELNRQRVDSAKALTTGDVIRVGDVIAVFLFAEN